MLSKRQKQLGTGFIKIAITILAVVFVIKRIDADQIAEALKSASVLFISLAVLFYTASKIVSAHRTFLIVRVYDIPVSSRENLRLYWKGMFFNMVLPGGIGGDAYKAVVLTKLGRVKFLHSAVIMILDRIAGAVALLSLAFVFLPFTSVARGKIWISIIGIVLVISIFIIVVNLINNKLQPVSAQLLAWSFIVQILQILSAWSIMYSYRIDTSIPAYLLLFLVSSLAAMLPLSVGGVGIREVVFLTGSGLLATDQNYSVAISFTFYLVSLLVALPGGLIKARFLAGLPMVQQSKGI